MKISDLIKEVRHTFPEADSERIILIAEDLERNLRKEFCISDFPDVPAPFFTAAAEDELAFDEQFFDVYVYFVIYKLALAECDTEVCNAYREAFEKRYDEMKIYYRRNFVPDVKTVKIRGVKI